MTDFLRNFSWQFYLLSEFLPEINREEIAEEILFVFCFDVWPGTRTLAVRLISQHYLQDHGDITNKATHYLLDYCD